MKNVIPLSFGNRRHTGTHYEEAAAEYLRQNGYRILEHNFRCRLGEIDLIAMDHQTLVFIEVKFRKNELCGNASDAVTASKQHTIYRVAEYYMIAQHIPPDTLCRFDVIGFQGDKLSHFRNAFGGM
ncbi:MAG: YraN family protein [Clostridiales bacterium]|nr:YraN family protein [Clostridiales bacterium]